MSSAYYQYCTWRINPADSVGWRLFNALIMVSIEDTARGKMAWLLKWKWMIYIQLWTSYCLTHKAICFCSYFQLITLTERAHSLSSDEVWWWRLMMSASSHHHLTSLTLFPLLVAAIEANLCSLFKSNCWVPETITAPKGLAQHNESAKHLLLLTCK